MMGGEMKNCKNKKKGNKAVKQGEKKGGVGWEGKELESVREGLIGKANRKRSKERRNGQK